jgi:hypothetical protein
MNNRCCDLVAAAFQQYALKPKAKILLVFTGLNVYYCMLD